MGAGKSLEILRIAYNYEERGRKTLLLTSSIDDRHGVGKITSRTGLQRDAVAIDKLDNIYELFADKIAAQKTDIVLVDEAMFLTKAQVWQLAKIVDALEVPVMCFGLRNDFQGNLFEGSGALMAIADKIEEIKTICRCGRKATINARIAGGKIVREGEQIQIGGNESYVALCRKCWECDM